MKLLIFFLLPIILFIFTACESKPLEAEVTKNVVQEDTRLPKFTLNTIDNQQIELTVSQQTIYSKSFKDKIVLLNFWAPWCEPCKKEMPAFVELQKKYKNDFIILGVLFDEKTSLEDVKKFLNQHDVNFPIVIGKENKNLAKVFDNVQMIPESFLYTRDGLFIEKFIGEISKEKLERYIKANM